MADRTVAGDSYAEPGATWWLLLLGPVLGLLGALTQLAGPGGVQVLVWVIGTLVITGFTAMLVAARRSYVAVQVTGADARFGQEWVHVAALDPELTDDAALTRVAGGGYSIPRGTKEVPLRLSDGTAVRGFARHPDRLRAFLHRQLDATG